MTEHAKGLRQGLLLAGVKNLQEFGYLAVDEKNILTDMIYSKFFVRLLEGTIEECGQNPQITSAAEALLKEISNEDVSA